MKIELTKQDRFLDYIKEQGPENPTRQVREDLKERGFWTVEEMTNVLDKWLDREVHRYMRALPKYDEEGNVIERINVERETDDGTKIQLYVQRSFLTYEDTVYAIRYRVSRMNYFRDEALRLYEDAQTRLPAKERRKLKRLFQGIFDFADPVNT